MVRTTSTDVFRVASNIALRSGVSCLKVPSCRKSWMFMMFSGALLLQGTKMMGSADLSSSNLLSSSWYRGSFLNASCWTAFVTVFEFQFFFSSAASFSRKSTLGTSFPGFLTKTSKDIIGFVLLLKSLLWIFSFASRSSTSSNASTLGLLEADIPLPFTFLSFKMLSSASPSLVSRGRFLPLKTSSDTWAQVSSSPSRKSKSSVRRRTSMYV
mmetsp:Transcript_11141/g.24585  ORF Transcript_11141/g.24585 Transcript_11141/m.24585 type:complete len:212 (-) Transcript_11141:516-1151(-)